MRDLLVIGNWKLHGNKKIITNLLITLANKLINISKCQIAIAPPLIYLDTIKNCLLSLNNNYIKLCAQNVDTHISGAFTGDISAAMLKDLGVEYVLIGHSERRIHHQENDSYIIKKFSTVKEMGLIPVLCIGENKTEYESGITQSICIKQIDAIIKSLGIQSFKNSIIAYEPTWAIGSGINAFPNNVQLIHRCIRNYIAQYDVSIANKILIQYGGSVNSSNVIQFISQKDIDGVLIGSASLNIESFFIIIQLIEKYIQTKEYD